MFYLDFLPFEVFVPIIHEIIQFCLFQLIVFATDLYTYKEIFFATFDFWNAVIITPFRLNSLPVVLFPAVLFCYLHGSQEASSILLLK